MIGCFDFVLLPIAIVSFAMVDNGDGEGERGMNDMDDVDDGMISEVKRRMNDFQMLFQNFER